jgi:hypothetical protein
MIRFVSKVVAISFLVLLTSPARAWWDGGHMQIAYLAYQKLTPSVRDRVDALLKLNVDYEKWTCGVSDQATARMYAFVHAATWADDIKEKAGYENDAVGDSGAAQNIGYADKKKHAYWHYKDVLYSPDGTPLPRPDPVDAVTQLKTMVAALPSNSTATDDIRSYDLVWILHLVGDVHQPLHAVQRHTAQIPSGDRGGNSEKVVPATGETVALHAYWDRVFGGYSSPYGAVFDASTRGGIAELRPDPALVAVSDPDEWVRESFELAKKFAYAAPVSTGTDAVELTREYETNARKVARDQAALAGARLGNLLNAALR